MGYLQDGVWREGWYDTAKTGGQFVREQSQFRHRVTADGGTFRAEPGRYHLYISFACPWAHRTLIFRKLKKLEDVISFSAVDPWMRADGWEFGASDPLTGKRYLRDIYLLADPHYSGRVTVPVLWDKRTRTIVSNESAEIIRMLNREFDAYTDARTDYCPEELRGEIDAINDFVYTEINNGVYRCGFASRQEAYEQNFDRLFAALDEIEARLGRQRYLVGDRLTEADWRLFTTLLRFDAVYYSHFKCNRNRIEDCPNLSGYLRDLYQVPGVAETVDMDQIKRHYYASHTHLNPTGIVPKGPRLDFTRPHDRARFGR
jgi:putative glutathione S-transferase